MTINQMEYFAAVVENRTFFDASQALHLSQSSLSKSIRRLENELGTALLDRTGRKAVPTKEGLLFYQGSKKILKDYEEMMSALKITAGQEAGRISLATLPVFSQYGLTGRLKEFMQSNPAVTLTLEEMEDPQLLRRLEQGECDAAVLRLESLPSDRYRTYPIAKDELAAVLPAAHPAAANKAISLPELAGDDFILMPKHVSIHQVCLEACKSSGFRPHILRTARTESILGAVAAGEGVSLLLRKSAALFRQEGIVLLPLSEPVISTLVLAVNKKRQMKPALRSLIQSFCSPEDAFPSPESPIPE